MNFPKPQLLISPWPTPRPVPCPKPKRLPARNKVAIAAGFVCMDGMILCADTQETITGYTKNSTEKIAKWEDDNFTLAVAGSGDSEIVQAVSQKLIEAGYAEHTKENYLYGDRAKKLIEEEYLRFFKKYLLP